MAGLDAKSMKKVDTHNETFDDSIVIELGLTGDITGYIALVYPNTLIKNLINSMMGFVPQVIDELEISALFEMSNIISGTICGQISKDRGILCDITTPLITQRSEIHPDERIALDTGQGILETDISIKYNEAT
jgi:chemotaxis protein CheY-P-specific phosphatase CheC